MGLPDFLLGLEHVRHGAHLLVLYRSWIDLEPTASGSIDLVMRLVGSALPDAYEVI
jgi:hypothetical protein